MRAELFTHNGCNGEREKQIIDSLANIVSILSSANGNDIISIIHTIIPIFEDSNLLKYLSQDKFQHYWGDLLRAHSKFLTDMEIGLGEQKPISSLNLFKQLLGFYYLILALDHDNKNKPDSNANEMFDEETVNFLEKASDYGSTQALLLLKLYYITKLHADAKFNEVAFEKSIEKFKEQASSPVLLAYGEMLLHIAQAKGQKITILDADFKPICTYDDVIKTVKKGIYYCYLGEFLQDISSDQIYNAYVVDNLHEAYPILDCVFYSFENDEVFESADDYILNMLTKTELSIDREPLKNIAAKQATVIKNYYKHFKTNVSEEVTPSYDYPKIKERLDRCENELLLINKPNMSKTFAMK